MKSFLLRLAVVAAACTVLGAQAPAQDLGFGAGLKLRAGMALGAPKDNLSRKMLGLGVEFTRDWAWGRVGLEVGYQYKPGNQYLTDVSAMPAAPGQRIDASQSVDSRKNRMEGLMGRLCFERALGRSPFVWRAGVQAGGTRYRQEYIGDITDGTTYEDTYNGTVEKTDRRLSPLAGLGWRIDREQALELNILWLRTTPAKYVHVAGTAAHLGGNTAWDYVETTGRVVPHLELGYVLRF